MWHFRHQPGIDVMLADYQLGTVNTNMFIREFSVKPVQASKQVLCLTFFHFLWLQSDPAHYAVVSILNLLQWFILFLEVKVLCQKLSLENQRNVKLWGKGYSFYCVVSSLHLESTESLLITSLRLIELWEVFEHLHGCISASLGKGFTMEWLVAKSSL